MSNQSEDDIRTEIVLDPTSSYVDPSREYEARLFIQNKAAGKAGSIVKNGYPYEYTVLLADDDTVFEYWFEAVRPDGTVETSERGRLEK